jgi:hypothetical protein
MLSFFTRKPFNYNYNSNLPKYVIDTTNKLKKKTIKDNLMPNFVSLQVIKPTYYILIPVFSMLSFLAGYYLSNK